MAKKVVIVVDMQLDFMDLDGSKLPIPGSAVLIEPMNDYLAKLDKDYVEAVLTTQDWHKENHIEYDPDGNAFPQHCVEETDGAEIVVDLEPVRANGIPVFSLRKNVFNMWEEPGAQVPVLSDVGTVTRDEWFDALIAKGISNVEIVGVAADVCVLGALIGACKKSEERKNFEVSVVVNLTKGLFRDINQVLDEESELELVHLI